MPWEFALIGIAAGFAAGYLGIGGGIIIVPALTLVFGRDPATAPVATHLAVATSLATMLATSLSSILAHQRRGAIAWDVVWKLTAGLLAGAVLGAWGADQVSTRGLAVVFGVFAVFAGLQMLLARPREGERPLPGAAGGTLVGSVIGVVSSLVGIGGGVMTGPWLMAHGVDPRRAVATAAACGYPIAVAGSLAFVVLGGNAAPETASLGYVHLPALAGIALFSVATAPVGAWAVHKSPPHRVRRAFAVLLLLVALRMILGAG